VIKINLLPLESFRRTASGQLSVTIFAVVMILAGFALYMANTMVMTPVVESMETSKQTLTTKHAQMRSQAAEALKQTTAFVKELVQVSAISELEERRRDQSRLFMTLSAQVNNQTSWLLNISHANGILNLSGMATDHDTVAALLDRLEQVPLLDDVELRQAAGDQVINNIKLVTFDIGAKTIFQPSTLLDTGLPEVNLPDHETIRKLVATASPPLAEALDRTRTAAAKAAL
jgi:Tfp pilus assembly protein PilN